VVPWLVPLDELPVVEVPALAAGAVVPVPVVVWLPLPAGWVVPAAGGVEGVVSVVAGALVSPTSSRLIA
jgi:hypothetical protein